MIERIDEAQSLIEELLCLRVLRGNRMVQVAESGDKRDWFGLRGRTHAVMLGESRDREQQHQRKDRGNFLHKKPPVVRNRSGWRKKEYRSTPKFIMAN